MRWWPFGRGGSADPQPSAAPGKPADLAAPPPVVRPDAEWRRLAPMRTAVETDPRVMPDVNFRSTLPSTWTVPAALAPLGHDVSMSAPPGLLPSLLAPIEGYADAPELRWPSVPEPPPPLDLFAPPQGSAHLAPSVIMQELPRPLPADPADVEAFPADRPGESAGPAVPFETVAVRHERQSDEAEPDRTLVVSDLPTPTEFDRRLRLADDPPFVPPPSEHGLASAEGAGSGEKVPMPSRPDPTAEPSVTRSLLGSPGLASTSEPRPVASWPAGVPDLRPASTTRPPRERASLERRTAPVQPAAESSERAAGQPTQPPEIASESRPTTLGTLAGEVLDRVLSPTYEAPWQPVTPPEPGDVDAFGGAEDAPPPAPSAGDPVERTITRTVERVGQPLTRVLRPTVGERLATHDFRLRPANANQPPAQGPSRSTLTPIDDPWAARSEAFAAGSPEPATSPGFDLPGLPADLEWNAADPGPRAEGESFVWDARSAMRFPDQGQDQVDPFGPPLALPDVTGERAAVSSPVPALDGFSIRPPRRRRALQVGIPTPKPESVSTETVASRRPAISPTEFVQDHVEGWDANGGQGAAAEWPGEPGSDDGPEHATGQTGAMSTAQDADAIADELYDRIRGRLRQELLIDRERNLLLTDLR